MFMRPYVIFELSECLPLMSLDTLIPRPLRSVLLGDCSLGDRASLWRVGVVAQGAGGEADEV